MAFLQDLNGEEVVIPSGFSESYDFWCDCGLMSMAFSHILESESLLIGATFDSSSG